MKRILVTMMAGAALWSAAALGAGSYFPATDDAAELALQKANAAYLQKDYLALTGSVRDALSAAGTDAVARQSALDLLAKANAETGGRLPADWHLPAGVTNMKFKQYRKDEPDAVIYEYALQATMQDPEAMAQVQVVRFPSQVVLDRKAGIGEWEVTKDDDGYSFDLYMGDKASPLPDGLYILNLELKDGTRANGWFVVSDMVASASPYLRSPAVGETVASGTPEIKWDDFRSPEYKPYERRILGLNVVPLKGTNEWKPDWNLYDGDPTRTQATVGRAGDGTGVTALDDGKYWVMVSYQERRSFGDVKLCRGARTGRYFYVKTH